MLAATELADKFFADQKLLVYLEGRKTPRQDFKSTGNGSLSSQELLFLPMRDLHQQVRYLPVQCRTGTVEL